MSSLDSFFRSLIIQSILYPIRRAQWIEQTKSINTDQLIINSSNADHDQNEIPMMALILQKLASSSPSPSSTSDLSEFVNLFHGYTAFGIGHGLKHLMMRPFGVQTTTILTHTIMVGVHRVGCDISNTLEWKEAVHKVYVSNGMLGGLFRGLIPQLISNYLHRIAHRSISMNGLIIPGVSNNSALKEIFEFVKVITTGMFASVVSYPFTTLSLRMQLNPEVSTSEIITDMTNEGISGIYAGFSTHLAGSVLSFVLGKVFDLVIRKPIKTY